MMILMEEDVAIFQNTLDAKNQGDWRELNCELQNDGMRLAIFILIDNPSKIGDGFNKIHDAIVQYKEKFQKIIVEAGFDQDMNGNLYNWNFFSDDELKEGLADQKFGLEPMGLNLRSEQSVYRVLHKGNLL